MKFSQHLEGLKHKPDGSIIKPLDSGMFELSSNILFNYKPGLLAAPEFKRCLSLLEKRLPYEFSLSGNNHLQHLQEKYIGIFTMIQRREAAHKERLEEMAIDVVREMYDVPEDIILNANLETGFDMGLETDDQDDSPDEILKSPPERMRYIREQIQKRIVLNGLVHGSSMHIWKGAHYIVQEKIKSIDSGLMELYDEYSAIVGYLLWKQNLPMMMRALRDGEEMENDMSGFMTQGFNEVKFDEEEDKINCNAVNFPVLLHEMTKGVMDYLICRGIPQDLSAEELKYYYAKADKYENEVWHYYLSPTIWIEMLDVLKITSDKIPSVIAKLSELDYKVLVELLKSVLDDKENAKIKFEVWEII